GWREPRRQLAGCVKSAWEPAPDSPISLAVPSPRPLRPGSLSLLVWQSCCSFSPLQVACRHHLAVIVWSGIDLGNLRLVALFAAIGSHRIARRRPFIAPPSESRFRTQKSK